MSTKKLMICFVLALLGLVCLLAALSSMFHNTGDYYTRVDSACMEEIAPRNGGMDHTYTLPAYDSRGKEKSISFDTNRALRDGAYLRLSYNALRGVTAWEETALEDIPEAAREMLDK